MFAIGGVTAHEPPPLETSSVIRPPSTEIDPVDALCPLREGAARERAVELLHVGQWFKRLPSDFPIPFEVWEVFVMPHMVTRDYKPPATTA